ncbi:MAG: phosphatidylglycerophosphatase A [Sphingomonadales bacterium]
MSNPTARPPITHPATLAATWFGVGLLPKAPGTWGSLAALPIAWIIQSQFGPEGLSTAILLLFALGWWAAGRYERLAGQKDSSEIVIDEVVGQWLVLLFVPPDIILYALGFVLFRVADIFKPWPVNLADRAIEGGLGVMVDDVLAALYGMAGMAVAQYLMALQGA